MYSGKGMLWNSLAYARHTNTFTIENIPCCCYKCVIQYFLNTNMVGYSVGALSINVAVSFAQILASPQYFPSSSLPLTAKCNNP